MPPSAPAAMSSVIYGICACARVRHLGDVYGQAHPCRTSSASGSPMTIQGGRQPVLVCSVLPHSRFPSRKEKAHLLTHSFGMRRCPPSGPPRWIPACMLRKVLAGTSLRFLEYDGLHRSPESEPDALCRDDSPRPSPSRGKGTRNQRRLLNCALLAGPSYLPRSFISSASSMVFTPSERALSSFEPGSAPTTT